MATTVCIPFIVRLSPIAWDTDADSGESLKGSQVFSCLRSRFRPASLGAFADRRLFRSLVISGAVRVDTVASERAVFYRAAYCMNPGRLLSTVTAHERLRHTGAVCLFEG